MKRKLTPSYLTGKHLVELLSGSADSEDLLRELMLRGCEHIIQKGLEEEVTDFLGQAPYERGPRRGYRNGYQDAAIRSTEGVLHLRRPRVRATEEPFESGLLRRVDRLEASLRRMAIEMYARGLSTRDIEETLVDEQGAPLLSRSSVSRLTDDLYQEYEAFASRDLSDFDVVYLFADGVYEAVRHYTRGQPVLCCWAVLSDGRKVLLHLSAAAGESSDAWTEFFEAMLARGLRQPLLVIHDGSAALKAAVSRAFPQSDRQRCLAHKLRNLAAKLPEHARKAGLARIKEIYYASDHETGMLLAERFTKEMAGSYPAAVKCFTEDLEACLTHLKYPLGHRKFIRTTNLIERAFAEEKRRTKVIPAHVNEKGAIKLVYAVLLRASQRWVRVTMSPLELAQLRSLRQTIHPHDQIEDMISYRRAA